MPATLPTPYDITPLPFFAYEPGARDWLMVGVVTIVVLGVILFISRRSRRNSTIEAISFALSELMALRRDGEKVLSKDRLARASLIVKRLASSLLGAPIAQFSPNELRRYVESDLSAGSKQLLERILALDAYKYQPDTAELPPAAVLGELIALVEKLQREVVSRE